MAIPSQKPDPGSPDEQPGWGGGQGGQRELPTIRDQRDDISSLSI